MRAILLALCLTAQAQQPAARVEFEVASVKPAANDVPAGAGRAMVRAMRAPGTIPMAGPGRVRLENWALADLIAAAYRVRASEVYGPAWLSGQGFDIEAKVPEDTPKNQLNAMLQALLEDRFGLKIHRETRTGEGFALVVGKNGARLSPPLTQPAETEDLTPEERQARAKEQGLALLTAMRNRIQENREAGTPLGGMNRATWNAVTCEELASHLERFTEAPVIDQTGLTGQYSVTIETWKNADVPGGTIFDAVEKLGLKLEPRKVTVESVAVEQALRVPTEN